MPEYLPARIKLANQNKLNQTTEISKIHFRFLR